jgi:hypothetical protein
VRAAAIAGDRAAGSSYSAFFARRRQHQADCEARSPAGLAFYDDLAAHDIDQQMRDRQAETGTGFLFGAVGISARSNGRKTRSISFGEMPIPVSSITKVATWLR